MKKEKKGFVWYGLRTSFLIMIGCWLLAIIEIIQEYTILEEIFIYLLMGSAIFTFVVSIIHLTKHKPKGLAVTALVLSSIIILSFLIGVFLGATGYYDYEGFDSSENLTEQEIQEFIDYIDNFCSISCQGLENVQTYDYQYDEELDEIVCYCLDSNYETILKKVVTFPSD